MRWVVVACCLLSCRSPVATTATESATKSQALNDPATDCAEVFGDALTVGFGRLDGTLVAIVPPSHPRCQKPDPDHVVLQIEMQGHIYRAAVNTVADRGPETGVRMQAVESTGLGGPTFEEGWHTDVALDYHGTFGMSAGDLAPQDITQEVTSWLEIGKPISVYAQSHGGSTTGLIYRTSPGRDGAVVVDPLSENPVFLIFAFAGQEF